jgi:methyl-accepting chemotaxis protein
VIVGRARQVNELVTGIATAADEQSREMGQISTAVSDIGSVTRANTQHATQTSAATEQLTSQVAQLDQCVQEMICLVDGDRIARRQAYRASALAA